MEKKAGSDRIPFRLRVKYSTVEQFLIDYSENINRGGTFVRTDKPLPPGTRLHLELEIAGLPVFIKIRGRVAWINNPAGEWHRQDLPPGMGILIFPDESSSCLLQYLAESLERSPYSREKTISPDYLKQIIENLRPDIQQFIKEKSERSDSDTLLKEHIENILKDK